MVAEELAVQAEGEFPPVRCSARLAEPVSSRLSESPCFKRYGHYGGRRLSLPLCAPIHTGTPAHRQKEEAWPHSCLAFTPDSPFCPALVEFLLSSLSKGSTLLFPYCLQDQFPSSQLKVACLKHFVPFLFSCKSISYFCPFLGSLF